MATASPIEWLWSGIALVGLLVNAWALEDAYRDRRALRAAGKNGARAIVASGNIRREWIRLGKMLLFLALGGYLLATSPAAPGPVPAGTVLAACLIAAVLLMVAGSILDRRERQRLIAYINRYLARRGIE